MPVLGLGETSFHLASGAWASRRGMYQQPPAGQLAELREFYGPVFRGLP